MSKEYNEYLIDHRKNVAKAFYWIKENLPELIDVSDVNLEIQITAQHDLSKFDSDEYFSYDKYFYGNNVSYEVKKQFDIAWLKHIHNNPHHWQHWILYEDDSTSTPIILDMPYNYIVEMICDWWSFSFKSGNLFEIFDFYNKKKNVILLSDNTRSKVEYILRSLHTKLTNMSD